MRSLWVLLKAFGFSDKWLNEDRLSMVDSPHNGSSGKVSLILNIIDRYGFPIFVVLVLMFGMYRGTVWVADRIFVPIAEGHLKLVNKQSELLDDISEEIKKSREDGTKREELLKKLFNEQERTTIEQTKTSAILERLLKSIESRPQM